MVVVLTPVGAHYSLIKSALEAGKHVYTEKTLSDDPEKARELLDLAEEKGLYLGSAPDTFLGAALQTARMGVDEGLLGEIHSFSISANRCNDLLLSLFPFLRQPGAGVLYDYGVYYLTALVNLLGPVARVGGIVGKPYPTHQNIIPWIDYIKVAPHQYLELFHSDGPAKGEDRELQDTYGYQHICLEAADIRAAWDAVIANGLTPDTDISLGADGAYQFWLTDPGGNRLELMEYAPGAKQLT